MYVLQQHLELEDKKWVCDNLMRDSEGEKLRDLLQWIDSLRKRSLWKVRKNHYYQFVESSAPHFSKLPLKINFILLFYFSIDKSQQLPMVEMGAKILVRNYNNYSQAIGDKFFIFFQIQSSHLAYFSHFCFEFTAVNCTSGFKTPSKQVFMQNGLSCM